MAKTALRVVDGAEDHADRETRMEEDKLVQVPLSKLKASEDNRKVGDVSDLVASIKEMGVIQPITVSPISGGPNSDYRIVFGHRRVEAAKKAGLKSIPAVVRNITERERLERSLVENLQREDLTPFEEAQAYDRLLKLEGGPSQRDLAKLIGRGQSHISKRLKLLKLPEEVIDALDSGGITIEDAMALADLAEVAPEEVEDIIRGTRAYDVPAEVAHRVNERQREAKRVEAQVKLEAKGVTVVEWPDDDWSKPGKIRLLNQSGAWQSGTVEMTPAEHRKEPCHGATVDPEGAVLYVCTDFSRHEKKGGSKVKAKTPKPGRTKSVDPDSPDPEREAKKLRREAQGARAEKLSKLLTDRLPVAEEAGIKDRYIVGSADMVKAKIACELLGVEAEANAHQRRLAEFASRGAKDLQRAARAVAIASAEQEVRSTYSWDVETILGHFEFLKRHGYSLSEFEKSYLKEVSQRQDEAKKLTEGRKKLAGIDAPSGEANPPDASRRHKMPRSKPRRKK